MNRRNTIWALASVLLFSVSGVRAQDQQSNSQSATRISPTSPVSSGEGGAYGKAPIPAARGVSTPYDQEPYDPAQIEPDMNTLSGAQLFGVGSLGHAHNIFDPSISFSALGESIPAAPGQLILGSQTIFNGILNFNRMWSRYHFTATYNGGESFYEGPAFSGAPNSQYHDLTISQEMDWERWRLTFRDDFSASPGAAFTGSGVGGPGLLAQLSTFGSSLNSVGQSFTPSESIQTGNAMRYRNAVLGQAEYSLSRRSAFTFSGSYGLLDFSDAGYISSQMVNAQAGYDYLLDPKNSIAIVAGYGKINYTGVTDSTTDYMAAFAYGRKITGRLAFQVQAGPQQIRVASVTQDYQLWFQSVNSGLTYDRRRSGVSLSYMRGLSGGSGVFLGATTNTFSGSAHYLFTRFWTGSVSGGYALNDSLAPAGVTTTSFNDWFVGANLGRQIGPHAHVNFNYGLQRQDNPSSCPVTSCGVTGNQQTFGMTLNWHLRPTG